MTKSVLLSSLKTVDALYPRVQVDDTHISDLVRAIESGEVLPPMIVSPDGVVVDGVHRAGAYRRVFAGTSEATVDVEVREYASDAELYLDAVRLNSIHGKKLGRQDQARIALRLRELHIDDQQISVALHVPGQQYTTLTSVGRPRIPAHVLTMEALLHQLRVSTFLDISRLFGEVKALTAPAMGDPKIKNPVPEDMRRSVVEMCDLAFANVDHVRLYLPSSGDAAVRLRKEAQRPNFALFELVELLGDVCRRMTDDLSRVGVMALDPWLVNYAVNPFSGWEKSLSTFPLIRAEVFEASFCMSLERFTGSVFHLMRVMEFGLNTLRTMVRVPKPVRAGWDGVIHSIDQKLVPVKGKRKSPAMRERHRFIADAVILLRAVKEARNTAMHDFTKSYSHPQAVDVYRSVQSFMLKMAEVA